LLPSKELLGEYERKILLDDDMGYRNMGVAQGALIDTPDGKWYAILFQDHGAVGRIPYLLPVSWNDGWPEIGIDGKVPRTFEIPFEKYDARPLIISDTFDHSQNKLDINWNGTTIPLTDIGPLPNVLVISGCVRGHIRRPFDSKEYIDSADKRP
jgi:beta-xylosidase